MARRIRSKLFRSARQEERFTAELQLTPQTRSQSYRLAYSDPTFILADDLRPVRLQLELQKPELAFQAHGVEATVVVFGSARLAEPAKAKASAARAAKKALASPRNPRFVRDARIAARLAVNARYYKEARRFARLVSEAELGDGDRPWTVITGGGPGIMEAANRGAHDAGAESIGLNIVVPHEQTPNRYITPALSFQFHYFAIRKMHFLLRARALVAFPGGFGTFDELFETLTLIQTGKIRPMPVLLFGEEFWRRVVDFDALVAEGMVSPADLHLFRFVATAEEALAAIRAFGAPKTPKKRGVLKKGRKR
ncbi:MAG: TIGR00730 family Rossman fold protein [Alphaproteobacteria bacterium]|nr:TIGR00730 family Rossman fold protein [Alphaproteobacteria bacterium]